MQAIEIPLTQGMTALVSPEDYPLVSQHKWCPLRGSTKVYAQANIKVGQQWKRVLMHRLILAAITGQLVDHEDGNGLNNQRTNIRIATRSGNQHNSGPRKGRFKGVSWHRGASKWVAQICSGGDRRYLGLFEKEEDAALAYDAEAVRLHGEFAKLNFPAALAA